MFTVSVPVLAFMFIVGLGLAAAGALLSLPRMAGMAIEIADEHEKATTSASIAANLQETVTQTTGSVVNLKDLLAQTEQALSDAHARAGIQDLKIMTLSNLVETLRLDLTRMEARQPQAQHSGEVTSP